MKEVKKTIRIFVLTVLGSAVGFSAFASGDIRVVKSNEDERLKLHVTVPESYDMTVNIADKQGNIVFSEYIYGKSVPGKLYNLENLEDGKYSIVTQAAHQTISKQFVIENSQIKAVDKSWNFAPYFKMEADRLKVNYLNENLNEIHLTLENEYRVFLKDGKENKFAYGKMINTENLPAGYYTVTLESGENSYKYYFEK